MGNVLLLLACFALIGNMPIDAPQQDDNTAASEADFANFPQNLLFGSPAASPGYTLFAPLTSNYTFLINAAGEVQNYWELPNVPGLMPYLLEDGTLLISTRVDGTRFSDRGGYGGRMQYYTWDGEVIWSFTVADDLMQQHHDIEPMPNGNVLLVVWEFKTNEEAAAVGIRQEYLDGVDTIDFDENDGGSEPIVGVWPDSILEVDPRTNEIVWRWNSWDHLVQDVDESLPNYGIIADNPHRINPNYFQDAFDKDLFHVNTVAYNAELDQIVLSARNYSEIWVIDHSTTTEEAAGSTGGRYGRGGDLLYRYGNPAAYDREGTRHLYQQHDPGWIEPGLPGEGNILIFDNGKRGEREYSRALEIAPPLLDDGTYAMENGDWVDAEIVWEYVGTPPEWFFAAFVSGVQRLPNGNTLIADGDQVGRMFEVTPDGLLAWMYLNPSNLTDLIPGRRVFRADRYPLDYPAFEGRDLTP